MIAFIKMIFLLIISIHMRIDCNECEESVEKTESNGNHKKKFIRIYGNLEKIRTKSRYFMPIINSMFGPKIFCIKL